MARENEVGAFRNNVPNADSSVLGGGGQARAPRGLEVVGFPGEAADPFGMAFQRGTKGLAIFRFP